MNLRIFPLLLLLVAGALPGSACGAPVDGRPLDQAEERLDYRISYRGIFTAYLWKELADMSLLVFAAERFAGQPVCRATLTVDTRNYRFAEFSYPVRLRYDALAVSDLAATRLVSDRDTGIENIHNVMWYDWPGQRLRFYRLRRQLPAGSPPVEHDFPSGRPAAHRGNWEAEAADAEALPEFLRAYPTVGAGLSRLVHERTVTLPGNGQALAAMDPLTMLYALRGYDYARQPERVVSVIHRRKIGQYLIRLVGKAAPPAGPPLLHVHAARTSGGRGSKGELDVWLSDDAQRRVVRMEIKAKVGRIRVELQQQRGSARPGGCA